MPNQIEQKPEVLRIIEGLEREAGDNMSGEDKETLNAWLAELALERAATLTPDKDRAEKIVVQNTVTKTDTVRGEINAGHELGTDHRRGSE